MTSEGPPAANGPRYLLVAGVGRGFASRPRWPSADQPFAGTASPDGTWFAWRLTAGNHRELGRSASVFPDQEAVRGAVGRVRARIADAQFWLVTAPRPACWMWRLHLDGQPIAASSRRYARYRECVYSARAFRAAAAVAEAKRLVSVPRSNSDGP